MRVRACVRRVACARVGASGAMEDAKRHGAPTSTWRADMLAQVAEALELEHVGTGRSRGKGTWAWHTMVAMAYHDVLFEPRKL